MSFSDLTDISSMSFSTIEVEPTHHLEENMAKASKISRHRLGSEGMVELTISEMNPLF